MGGKPPDLFSPLTSSHASLRPAFTTLPFDAASTPKIRPTVPCLSASLPPTLHGSPLICTHPSFAACLFLECEHVTFHGEMVTAAASLSAGGQTQCRVNTWQATTGGPILCSQQSHRLLWALRGRQQAAMPPAEVATEWKSCALLSGLSTRCVVTGGLPSHNIFARGDCTQVMHCTFWLAWPGRVGSGSAGSGGAVLHMEAGRGKPSRREPCVVARCTSHLFSTHLFQRWRGPSRLRG